MTATEKSDNRVGFCPVYDIECPSGSNAAVSCEGRLLGDYNPLTNFRDSDIEHCAIYRREQEQLAGGDETTSLSETKNLAKGEE
ncbi:MAG: hypothetical protein HQ508_04710 [Candidatus Marinimicrobia bacterium]|nr:hypothetical protein [Candidatus Neomarinimicrobiota bacterium]